MAAYVNPALQRLVQSACVAVPSITAPGLDVVVSSLTNDTTYHVTLVLSDLYGFVPGSAQVVSPVLFCSPPPPSLVLLLLVPLLLVLLLVLLFCAACAVHFHTQAHTATCIQLAGLHTHASASQPYCSSRSNEGIWSALVHTQDMTPPVLTVVSAPPPDFASFAVTLRLNEPGAIHAGLLPASTEDAGNAAPTPRCPPDFEVHAYA